MAQTRCPYCCELLDKISSVNEEHILPVALGAPKAFFVPAAADENSRMNKLIDSPTTNDPLIRMLAAGQGVVSRSGPVVLNVDGVVSGSDQKVKTVLSKSDVQVRFAKPVEVDEATGHVKGVRGFGDAAMQHALQIQRDHEKKGIQIELGETVQQAKPSVNVRLSANLVVIRQELIKTAYLFTVRVFGDDAIVSPSGGIFRAAMLCTTLEAIAATGLGGSPQCPLPPIFPKLAPNQHALCTLRIDDEILTAVSLFGTFNCLVKTPATGFSAPVGTGETVLIDASQATLQSWTAIDWCARGLRPTGSA